MIHQKALQEELILFTRYPVPGQAKTRLIPKLGAAGAAGLQQTMSEQTVRTAMETVEREKCGLTVYFTDGSHLQMQQWLGTDLSYCEQTGSDLGQRLFNAFVDSRQRGMQRTLIIGADCPELNSQLLSTAFEMLNGSQLVLGPSTDGGYYLVGTNYDLPEHSVQNLFTDMPWGTSAVLQKTLERAKQMSASVSMLKELNDIDTPYDLEYFDYNSNS